MAQHSPVTPSPSSIFGLWSQTYDHQPNPMLTLEARALDALLPNPAGLDVLDLGCGTGRWLSQLAQRKPASLIGIDLSPEMLAVCRQRLGPDVQLFCCDAVRVSRPSNSFDLILCSFLLSHVHDLNELFGEIRRLLRDHGTAFISDLHPATAHALGWQRAFHSAEGTVPLEVANRPLSTIFSALNSAGLEVAGHVEPAFGAVEHETLRLAGKAHVVSASRNLPAIYILQIRPRPRKVVVYPSDRVASIRNAHIALGPQDTVSADLTVAHSRIAGIGVASHGHTLPTGHSIDLSGFTLLPGLVNAHDHLEFELFPRLGDGPYHNCTEWYADIHHRHADTIRRHRRLRKSTRIWWGGLRNLLSGVTTVCHHNPLSSDMLAEDFPIRVLCDFGWAHSVALDSRFSQHHHRTPPDQPFIIHAAEGLGTQSADEIRQLETAGVLDSRTVLVHGLACTAADADMLNRRGAALIWCPSSNSFLFGRTHSRSTLSLFDRVAIGSDSPLTAKGDLLDEIRFAHRHVGVPAMQVFQQATSAAADVLRLKNGAGRILIGGYADLIAVRNVGLSPSQTLAQSTFRDIHLVLRGGRVQLASPEMYKLLPPALATGLRPLQMDGTIRWLRAPLGRLFSEAIAALGCDIRLSGRRVRHVCTDWL